MPFHYLTGARIRHSTDINVEVMRDELCHGQSLTVALIGDDAVARFADLAKQLRWSPATLTPYRTFEGAALFAAGRFDAASGPASDVPCTAANSG